MENLAGKKDCDKEIENELTRCGIEIVRNQPRERKVPSSLRGKLGQFSFARAWYYWVVTGPTPLNIAQELFSDPVGKTDIRVVGHCGCPPPEAPWITWRTAADQRIVIPKNQEAEWIAFSETLPSLKTEMEKYIFNDNPSSVGAKPFIESYHIDTEIGLRLFADTLKKHYLA